MHALTWCPQPRCGGTRARDRVICGDSRIAGTDVSNWPYNGGSITSSSERPADLGYYIGARIIGARITESYYAKAADKRRAVAEIIAVTDFDDFLEKSGYSP